MGGPWDPNIDYRSYLDRSADHQAKAVEDVLTELERASAKFGPFLSALEGQAIIAEEFDEFTEAVRHEGADRARAEAIQLAAMAIRFLIDVPAGSEQKNEK